MKAEEARQLTINYALVHEKIHFTVLNNVFDLIKTSANSGNSHIFLPETIDLKTYGEYLQEKLTNLGYQYSEVGPDIIIKWANF